MYNSLCVFSYPLTSQLIPLPRTPNIEDILSDYEASLTTSSSSKDTTTSRQHISRSLSLTKEIISGIKIYFEKTIGNNLLYRFERGQYGEIKRKYQDPNLPEDERREMIQVYGVEHLLRLFGESCLVFSSIFPPEHDELTQPFGVASIVPNSTPSQPP